MKDAPFLNLVLAVLLLISVGWLLIVGRPILLPILTAVISVYVIVAASQALARLPVLRLLPAFLLRLLALGVFAVAILVFAIVVAATVRDIIAAAPGYAANLNALFEGIAARFGIETQQIWDQIRAVTVDRFDIQQVALLLLGGFTTVGATIFLVIVYAAFIIAERGGFAHKVAAALQDENTARATLGVITEINRRISDYLVVKTLINLILGALSFVVLRLIGVDFALFWAIGIALLNYIPYFGSYIGVAFPVVLSLAQFASFPTTVLLAVLLVAAQTLVGYVLEPRLIGRQVNLSPFVVMVALSVWGSLWGIPGAILAVPMTSVLAIVLSSFTSTRFLAVLLAERPVAEPSTDPAIGREI